MTTTAAARPYTNGGANKVLAGDRAVHDWYRFVLSYPPHLVREYVDRFGLCPGQRVLDPFCGTGTTLVECKMLGIESVGAEANPMAHFASATKVDWTVDPEALVEHAAAVAECVQRRLDAGGIPDVAPLLHPDPPETAVTGTGLRTLPDEAMALLLANSISPRPLHKTLELLDCLGQHADPRFDRHERLALASALVSDIGNLHFGPEVGVGPAKLDAPVVAPWLAGVRTIANDLRALGGRAGVPAAVHRADARDLGGVVAPGSIDAVITSPPYPNEKDYTRTTRLESVLLGFLRDRADLRALKAGLVRSNTRNVYKGDDDDGWVAGHPEIQRIAGEIEERRVALGKTSGFERQYARVTTLYFGGVARHLAGLRPLLRPGARLAYVVGDQASYLRVMIRTGQLLGGIAESLGYEVESLDLFRTRLATATRAQLREEVVVLRWAGRQTYPVHVPANGSACEVARETAQPPGSPRWPA